MFYESYLAGKPAFKVKQLVVHELSNSNVKRSKISPALAASLWIGDHQQHQGIYKTRKLGFSMRGSRCRSLEIPQPLPFKSDIPHKNTIISSPTSITLDDNANNIHQQLKGKPTLILIYFQSFPINPYHLSLQTPENGANEILSHTRPIVLSFSTSPHKVKTVRTLVQPNSLVHY